MALELREGIGAVESIKRFAGRLEMYLARGLARRAAAPLVLAGTLSVAAFGAAAINNQPQVSQMSPMVAPGNTLNLDSAHTFCFPTNDGTGQTICHVLASQVSVVPHIGACTSDPDGDGTFICVYATDPTAGN